MGAVRVNPRSSASSAAVLDLASDGLRACHEWRCSTDHGACTSASGTREANAYVVGLTAGVGNSGQVLSLSIACPVRSGDGL